MVNSNSSVDVLILGASAAGLMCAIEAGKRQRKVLVLDHANKAGKKILMSGGGRCNFTNYQISADNYISHNPHFCKSALNQYTQWDFIQLIEKHHMPYHEREHGQLFCNNSAKDILRMLLDECKQVDVNVQLNTLINKIQNDDADGFTTNIEHGKIDSNIHCHSLVIATGGLSIPKMCASPIGYQIAEQFGIKVWPTQSGLVPFTMHTHDKDDYALLSGISVDCLVSNSRQLFRGNILFTHRGLSGPAILQISSYWKPGETVTINLLPDLDLRDTLSTRREKQPNKKLKSILNQYLPKRVVTAFVGNNLLEQPLQHLTQQDIEGITKALQYWLLKPNGTEGYRTAEVTLGGVDCDALSSKTMQSIDIQGLYFIGEVVDITGWLGGYNFQWAWSSGWCAGQYV